MSRFHGRDREFEREDRRTANAIVFRTRGAIDYVKAALVATEKAGPGTPAAAVCEPLRQALQHLEAVAATMES